MPKGVGHQIYPLIVFRVSQLLDNNFIPHEIRGTVQQGNSNASLGISTELQVRWTVMWQFNHVAYQDLITAKRWIEDPGIP